MEAIMKDQKSRIDTARQALSAIQNYFPMRPQSAVLLFAFLLFFTHRTSAQNETKNLLVAFENSYSMEAKADYSRAIKTLKDVYQENSYEINLRLGWLHYLAGLHLESITYYQKAIKLRPYSIEPKFGYVLPAAAMGNWAQVIYQYQEILKIDPQNTIANYRMGSIYYNKQDYLRAEKYIEKVVNLYPFDYDSNLLFGWISFKLGKLREAKVLFTKVLLNKPKDASALEGLSLIK